MPNANGDDDSDGGFDDFFNKQSRRQILLGVSSVGVSSLAGCGGSSEVDDGPGSGTRPATSSPTPETTPTSTSTQTTTDQPTETTTSTSRPPSVSVVSFDTTPSQPRQFQPVTLSVSLENTGGSPFEGTLTFDSDVADSTSLSVSVPVQESITKTTEMEWTAVGSKSIALSIRNTNETVVETTRTVEVGQYPEHHVEVDGTRLTCGEGTVYFAGVAPTLIYDPSAVEPRGINGYFRLLSDIGCSSARVWAYSPRWSQTPSITAPYTYNDAFSEHFDHVVAKAKKHDIRLFATLFNGNPTHAPDDHEEYIPQALGTNIVQFVEWADDAEVHNDFFHSTECRDMYKDWVREVVTHQNHITGLEYRDDPTIAMWELGNEIQYGPPRGGESIRHWIEDVGAFVKGLDDQTLLTTGSYGHQGCNAYVEEASADPIDVASIHYYPGPHHYDVPEDQVIPILEETIKTTHEEIEKPLYIGEYNWGVGSDATTPLTERNTWLGRIHDVCDANDVAAANLWSLVHWSREETDTKPTTAYAQSDEGTIAELKRYIEANNQKSTSDCLTSSDQG